MTWRLLFCWCGLCKTQVEHAAGQAFMSSLIVSQYIHHLAHLMVASIQRGGKCNCSQDIIPHVIWNDNTVGFENNFIFTNQFMTN